MGAGQERVTPYVNVPSFPSTLGSRGKTYALADSGNYIMRSGSDANARQINFDAGPKGGVHGHFDLFGFELSGFGRPLLSDPGAYNTTHPPVAITLSRPRRTTRSTLMGRTLQR